MADEAKEPSKSSDGPGVFTLFAVAVGAGLTVHLLGKYFERRESPRYAALPPMERDPWDFEG